MEVKFKKLHKDAVIPSYAKPGDAGLDLTAVSVEKLSEASKLVNFATKFKYGTGLAVEIPEGYVGLLFPRSSIHKYPCRLANSVGVIDSGYRGEICFVFDCPLNTHPGDSEPTPMLNGLPYSKGDKIGQLVIMPYPKIEVVEELGELSNTERGDGGFGSSGK